MSHTQTGMSYWNTTQICLGHDEAKISLKGMLIGKLYSASLQDLLPEFK